MIGELVTAVGSVVTGITDTTVSAINSLVGIFWDGALNNNAGGFTFLGYLTLVGLGITVINFALSIVNRYAKVRK